MQVHVAYSMRSFPSIYSGINSVWAHNSCEGVLMWVSPYQVNELLSFVDTCMVCCAAIRCPSYHALVSP